MHKFSNAPTQSSDLPVLYCLGLLGVLLKKKGDSLLCPLFQVENRQHVPQISSLASAEKGTEKTVPPFLLVARLVRSALSSLRDKNLCMIRARSLGLLAVLQMLLFVPGPALVQGGQGGKANDPMPVSPAYVIQPNDLLEIVVWGEPEISRTVLVRPDGRISLPLVQDLQASDLTPVQLKEQMENRLQEYVDSPNVTVIVEAIQSYKVYVIGKIQTPGGIVVEKPITVLQALSLAGGFREYADESEIHIVRTSGDQHRVFEFNYKDVIKGKKAEQNILLRSGDVVVVP